MTTQTLNTKLAAFMHKTSSLFKKVDKKSLKILLASILLGIAAIIMIFMTVDNRQSYSNSMDSIMPTKNIEDKSIRFFNR